MISVGRKLTLALLAIFACFVSGMAIDAAEAKPNVIVILTDDQGWGDVSLHGNKNLSTPNIDSLATEGASFDRFYVCPVCSPTRAEFLTGRYHPRGGVYSTSAGGERLDLDEMTIAQTFQSAGYATAAFGKWHNGMQYPYHPNGRGFDEFYGFCSGHWGNYFSPPLDHNGKIVKGKGFVIDDFTTHALQFIEQHRDQPFFVYLPYNTPHSPMQVPDEFWEKHKAQELAMHNRDPRRENLGHIRAAYAMCENIDWNVGRILKKLDQLKLAENTIIAYFHDNGPNGVRWNGDMKGRKGSTDEGGVRSPLFVRWPKEIQPGTKVKVLGAAIDLLPTLSDMAGIRIASKKPLDGISLTPEILGLPAKPKRRMIFSHWRGKTSVRTRQYRLGHKGQLFDMTKDPGQRNDISKQNPEIAARLKAAVANFDKKVVPANLTDDQRPFLIGHQKYPYTQIPARDGTAHGNIKRSNRFPNCSYFTNWTSANDKVTWQATVAASGKYKVEVHYACPAKDIGSTIELSFNSSKVVGQIAEAHDPPILGGEHDRVKRAESYVREFRSLDLGVLDLKEGEGTLTLKALKMPKSQVMDFRLIFLTRIDG